jgi:hypothetical protein
LLSKLMLQSLAHKLTPSQQAALAALACSTIG